MIKSLAFLYLSLSGICAISDITAIPYLLLFIAWYVSIDTSFLGMTPAMNNNFADLWFVVGQVLIYIFDTQGFDCNTFALIIFIILWLFSDTHSQEKEGTS